MIAFDTDVITLILHGSEYYVERAATIPPLELALPVPVFEEVMRGRLNVIRQADSGKIKLSVADAYEMLRKSAESLRRFKLLGFNPAGETLMLDWKTQRIKAGTLNLRIAASCVVVGARLVSRNCKDFDKVPGLQIEYWTESMNS